MSISRWILIGVYLSVMAPMACGADAEAMIHRIESLSEKQLQRWRQKYPRADLNRDGTLTKTEAIAYLRQASQPKKAPSGEKASGDNHPPTYADLAYGTHPRHRFDVWVADGEGPRPLVVFIHGGGFRGGDKSSWRRSPALRQFLKQGVSCAAINYRFRKDAPIQAILHDVARAVQTLRHRSDKLRIDVDRIAGWGGSAGAGSSLWLTVRDDLADADARDPIERQSSRLGAAVLVSTQATYDLTRWSEFLPEPNPDWMTPDEVPQFYHLDTDADLQSPAGMAARRESDMLRWISPGDGPVFIHNGQLSGPPRNRGHYLHHPRHAETIAAAYAAVGALAELSTQTHGTAEVRAVEFVMQHFSSE